MDKGRLEAFSDGVIAIIITVMVLEMKIPLPHQEPTLADLKPILPYFFSYALSYVFLGLYWNNHHHMFQATERVTGATLWANLHLLFWLSLIPFTTAWTGANSFARIPTALYGVVLLLAAIAYYILQWTILHAPGGNPILEAALANDWKGKLSPVIYVAAVALCFVSQWIACALYVLVALIWLIPDRRIERTFTNREGD
jgi:uncharacterized membrane protein